MRQASSQTRHVTGASQNLRAPTVARAGRAWTPNAARERLPPIHSTSAQDHATQRAYSSRHNTTRLTGQRLARRRTLVRCRRTDTYISYTADPQVSALVPGRVSDSGRTGRCAFVHRVWSSHGRGRRSSNRARRVPVPRRSLVPRTRACTNARRLTGPPGDRQMDRSTRACRGNGATLAGSAPPPPAVNAGREGTVHGELTTSACAWIGGEQNAPRRSL